MTNFQTIAARYVEMWNAADSVALQATVAELCAADVRYTDPLADASGREALAATIGAVHDQFPGFRFVLSGPVDGHHGQARFGWELGPGDAPAPIAGFDVVTVDDDGRLTRVLGFLDRVPSA